MSTCIPTASAATAGETTAAITTTFSLRRRSFYSNSNGLLSLSSNSFPKLRLSSQSSQSSLTRNVGAKALLNNVGMDSAATSQSNSDASTPEVKNGKPSTESVDTPLASEDSISEFIAQVASLVKLVDSRDIVELQLKQHDCELLIRKKEAMEPTSPPPVIMMQSPSPPTVAPQAIQPVSAPTPSPQPAPSAAKPAKSSIPSLKSPMAGTFYRSPAPGAPPFVKVGDKVQKGQVVCIIEAMKLTNEIEADQSGTLVEVLAEDGKPVSIDTPLFAIQP